MMHHTTEISIRFDGTQLPKILLFIIDFPDGRLYKAQTIAPLRKIECKQEFFISMKIISEVKTCKSWIESAKESIEVNLLGTNTYIVDNLSKGFKISRRICEE